MNEKIINKMKNELLNEMATVGSIAKNNTKYSIYPELQGNPSFHISATDFEVVLQIVDFLVLEWKRGKAKVKGEFPADDMKIFYRWARSENELGVSNWLFLLQTWNTNNPKYRVGLDTSLPERVLYEK